MEQTKAESGTMEPIEVTLGGCEKPLHRIRFKGEWLVEPDSDLTRSAEFGRDAGDFWGVALTNRGRLFVYRANVDARFDAYLDPYDSFEGAGEVGGVPGDILAEARAVVDPDHVQELDI